ncbi:MAG: cupin-like domain-containing protein [Flavobacteriales bacterium]|nr:cupin-like domain-containing protein [Flavobacteriales bacterium]
MQLLQVDIHEQLSPEAFRAGYLHKKPVVIRSLSESWPARDLWTWDYLKEKVGDRTVEVFSNRKNAENQPVHTPHATMSFHDYIDGLVAGEGHWRLFLFDILKHCPELLNDFTWPTGYFGKMLKRFPMLFTGYAGSVTHLHYDMDLSDVIQTQFLGRKRVLLFPFEEQHKLYRRPFEVMSLVDFTGYYKEEFNLTMDEFPALALAKGYEVILEHGDTLYMPSKFWHHMEYLEAGIGLSLRSWQYSLQGKLSGLYHIIVMRHIDGIMKRTAPDSWYEFKIKQIRKNESKELSSAVQ